MKILIIVVVFIAISVNVASAQTALIGKSTTALTSTAESLSGKSDSKHGKAIAFAVENSGVQSKGIRFISSSGEEKKRIVESGEVKQIGGKWVRESHFISEISEGSGLVMIETRKSEHDYDPRPEMESAAPKEVWDEKIQVLNGEGNIVSEREFRTYPGEDLLTTTYWKNEFSKNGDRYFVYYRDQKGNGNVEVYTATGEKMAHGYAYGDIEKIEISPDGQMVAGYVYPMAATSANRSKHIFFLETNSGKTKIVKGAGILGAARWGASFMFFNPSPQIPKEKIWIAVKSQESTANKKSALWSGYLSFSEIPEDLSRLLGSRVQK